VLLSDFHCKENDSKIWFPGHTCTPTTRHQWLWSGSLFVESSMSWVYGYNLETKSFCHFPYNENPTRAINTTSLKCCLSSIDAIDRWKKIHTCIWMFKVASCKCVSLKSTRFSKKKERSETFLIESHDTYIFKFQF
jgi:hypothetical protein